MMRVSLHVQSGRQRKKLPSLVCSEESKELKFFTKEELKRVKIVETHIPILKDYLSE